MAETLALSQGPGWTPQCGVLGPPAALAVSPPTAGQMSQIQLTPEELRKPLEFALRHRCYYIALMLTLSTTCSPSTLALSCTFTL